MIDIVLVAKLGKTVGLKGFLRLHSFSDFNEILKKGLILSSKQGKRYEIEQFSPKTMLVRFVGYENIDLAKELVNLELFQSMDETRQACKLKEDEYFHFDIIGCKIVEDEEILGIVEEIIDQGPSSLLKIKANPSFYIPYVNRYILNVDISKKSIYTKGAKLILQSS